MRKHTIFAHFCLLFSALIFSIPFIWLLLSSFQDDSAPFLKSSYLNLPGSTTQNKSKPTPNFRLQNYTDALTSLPPEAKYGFTYLKNTLWVVFFSVIGTVLSSAMVAYGFARFRFTGHNAFFIILLGTIMLPSAVTLLPTFLIFRQLNWVDSLLPLWLPSFFAVPFYVFMLRQFFLMVPVEYEHAARIDGCSWLQCWWRIMMPQIKPALAVVAVWTFIHAWNNFSGPLIYINSSEKMTISYATKLFESEMGSTSGLMMAFAVLAIIPVIVAYLFAQKHFERETKKLL